MKFKSVILAVLVFLAFQSNAQKIQDQNFQVAYNEISAMLEGKQPLDFERAVFLTETAYRGNAIEYKDFRAVLDVSTEMIQQLIKANDRQDWKQYVRDTKVTPQRELQAKESYQRALANWAIYTWMTDTVEVRLNNQQFFHLPLSYSNNDPFGTTDWRNSQVLNLFESGKGNCYSLVTLFKILSERFKSEASIVTAPQHIYIEHRDPNGNTFNVELPTRSFPNMGSIQTLTYTTREGLLNDISMRTLDLKQSVGLCLVYLAKGYQYKHNIGDDEFLLNCAIQTLRYDPKNLNALLLKAQVYEQRVMKQQREVAPYESLLADLYTLGYRQMPDDMRDVILSKIQGRQAAPVLADKNPNPYRNISEQSRYVTLSNGLFDEVHQSQKIVRYGRTIFDTEKSKIVKFLDEDVSSYQVDPVVFALSVDPLTKSYPELTPYQFASNTPIAAIDLDGLEKVPANEVWTYDGYGSTEIGLVDESFVYAKNQEGIFQLHRINGGRNDGNYLARQFLGRSDGVTYYKDKYIVGKDQFEGFRDKNYEGGPKGIGYQVRQAGVALGGTRYSNPDGTNFDHLRYLKDVWTDPYVLVGSAHATIVSLPPSAGMMRAIQYSSKWQNASLKNAINKFAPGVEGVETSTGKTLYTNSQTGIQVVLDNEGRYFRIENTSLTGNRRYLDLDGNIPNNKTINGKQSGRSQSEYNEATHFNNTDDL